MFGTIILVASWNVCHSSLAPWHWKHDPKAYIFACCFCLHTTKMQQIGWRNFVENILAREEAFLIAFCSNSPRSFPSCMLIFCIYAQNIITTVTSLFLNLSELVILPHFQGYGEGILSQIPNFLLIKPSTGCWEGSWPTHKSAHARNTRFRVRTNLGNNVY